MDWDCSVKWMACNEDGTDKYSNDAKYRVRNKETVNEAISTLIQHITDTNELPHCNAITITVKLA